MAKLHIGGAERNYIAVHVLRRQHPECMDYWDGNWLISEIEIQTGVWFGRYRTSLRAGEFSGFRQAVEKLQGGLAPEARFETMEEQLSLRIYSDHRGQMVLDGEARDIAGYGALLQFTELPLGASTLDPIIAQLTEIEHEFPLRE